MEKRASPGMVGRAVVMTLGAAMVAALAATPAQAAQAEWTIDGPLHYAEIPGVYASWIKAHELALDDSIAMYNNKMKVCKRSDSHPFHKGVRAANDAEGRIAILWGYVICTKNRATG